MKVTGTAANGAKVDFSLDAVIEYSKIGTAARVWVQLSTCCYRLLLVDNYSDFKAKLDKHTIKK